MMGGLRHKMPWTAYTMLVGCLAIIGAGVPFLVGFSGYYSKDAIIAQALSFWQSQSDARRGVLFRGCRRRFAHGVLHVPALVSDVCRHAARSSRVRPCPRVAADDVRAAGGAGRFCG